MAKTLSFTVSLFFILCFVLPSEAIYDYFQMVQQWPPATCSGLRCYAPPPRMFTIHGLWPSNYSTTRYVCTGSQFNPAQIASLRGQLNTYWPDVIRGNNQNFWRHEWDSHGTCSENLFNEFQYFQLTLNMRTNPNYDLLTILNRAGLPPTANTIRTYAAIENAIQAATGRRPGLRCNVNAATRQRQLNEIILCFDQTGQTLIDCTNYAGSNCPSHFVWLPRPPLTFWGLVKLLIYWIPIAKLLVISIVVFLISRICRGGGWKRD